MPNNNKYKFKFTFAEKQSSIELLSTVIVYGDSLEQGMFKLVTIVGKDKAAAFKVKSIEELSSKKALGGLQNWDRGQRVPKSPYTSSDKLEEALATMEGR